MTTSVIDWKLVLEFLKVLVPVGIAIYVTRAAIGGFRKQKALERRIDWHERTYRALDHLMEELYFFQQRTGAMGPMPPELDEAVAALSRELSLAFLYSDELAFEFAHRLQRELVKAFMTKTLGPREEFNYAAVTEQCDELFRVLPDVLRKELGTGYPWKAKWYREQSTE